MIVNRTLQFGIVLAALALGACGKSDSKKVEDVQAICPVFASKVKACGDAFPKAWTAAGETDTNYDRVCRGQTVGYGVNHPDWMAKLETCATKTDDCQAFAKCGVELFHVR